ncbi:MAG TPA: metallophosphoesterase [Polyangiaceae bacterium]
MQQRRELLRLLGVSGVTFASGLWGCAEGAAGPASRPTTPAAKATVREAPPEDFFFLQLSDTHWGYEGAANPEADRTLRATIATINAVSMRPEFVIFTGDLTHNTDDPVQRRARMKEFKAMTSELAVKEVRFIPGEHDASFDAGEAYREFFGETHYAFEHYGVSFLALDNVSQPGATLGEAQLAWLEQELGRVPKNAPLVVFAHRPLFDLYPAWDWATKDGARAIELLQRHPNVSVFYGHIHQQHEQRTGSIVHRAARSLVFPLPAPGSVPKKAPLSWDPQSLDHGLGYRQVSRENEAMVVQERPFAKA